MAEPRPRLDIEERPSGRVALVMRRGVGRAERTFGELPAKLRPVFEVACALEAAAIPSERWRDVVNAGMVLLAQSESEVMRRLVAPRDRGEGGSE